MKTPCDIYCFENKQCLIDLISCVSLFTTARFVYAASPGISSHFLCRGCVVVAASWLEARTGGPRDQSRTARELS